MTRVQHREEAVAAVVGRSQRPARSVTGLLRGIRIGLSVITTILLGISRDQRSW